MILIPDDLRARLIANGTTKTEADHVPVVKLFVAGGAATWLLTELLPDGDTLFGLCDMGSPELGYVSLGELEGVQLPFGLRIERDPHFRGRFPLSVYAEAARRAGAITEAEGLLRQAAAALNRARNPDRPEDGG
ncbi:DUF2958 domain-containing protein [Inquilinus limosus]|uniref:DUF2958 domain-containing protein n=1 Tax=Inquilinus limosus TaxID=171674 RepID=UPI003F16BD4D